MMIHWLCTKCRIEWWARDGDTGPCKACGNGRLECLGTKGGTDAVHK